MQVWKRWSVLVLWFFVAACGPKQPIQGEVVKSISFEGNSGFFGVSDSKIRASMEQSQSAGMWWMQPAQRAQVLDRSSLAKDAWRIETWYANNGYFGAKVHGWDIQTVRKATRQKISPKW